MFALHTPGPKTLDSAAQDKHIENLQWHNNWEVVSNVRDPAELTAQLEI